MFNDFIKNHVIIWLINKYWGTEYVPAKKDTILYVRKYLKSFTLQNGVSFNMHKQEIWLPEVLEDYDWSDLKPDDIVLDIGSNIGGFALIAANKVKKVVAVEPIFTDVLKENIILNKLENINVINGMLGDTEQQNLSVSFDDSHADKCKVYSFDDLVKICGEHVDFLKCDCEGGEAAIPLESLLPIRRIEIEIHDRTNPRMIALRNFIFENWEATEKIKDPWSMMVHAYKKN